MKLKCLVVVLFVCCFSYSQEAKRSLYLKINTLSLVDVLSFPTLQVSLEKKITPYFSLIPEVGYQIYREDKLFGESLDTIILKEKGFKANIEGRFYLSKIFPKFESKKHNGLFCGLQLFYRQNQETNSVSYFKNETNYVDYFGVKKKVYGLNLTTGFQLVKRRIVFEPSIGIGIMNRIIKNYEIQFDDSKDEISDPHYFFPNFESKSGTSFNLSLCLRVGYQLY